MHLCNPKLLHHIFGSLVQPTWILYDTPMHYSISLIPNQPTMNPKQLQLFISETALQLINKLQHILMPSRSLLQTAWTIMSHSQHNVSKLLIKLHFSYAIKVLYFFFFQSKFWIHLYFAFSLSHLGFINDELFIRSTRILYSRLLFSCFTHQPEFIMNSIKVIYMPN